MIASLITNLLYSMSVCLLLPMHVHIAPFDSIAKAVFSYEISCCCSSRVTFKHQAYMSAVAFDAFPMSSHPSDPTAAAPQAIPESSSGQLSSGLPAHDSSFTSSSSARGVEQPPPPQHLTGADSAAMSRKPSLSLSTGSRTPSLLARQNLSTNSLSSLASGSGAAVTARSPSPASEYMGSHNNVSEAESETQKLRRQIHQIGTRHEEELRKLAADHDANVAAVQAQAVAKMKELIEKVSKHRASLAFFGLYTETVSQQHGKTMHVSFALLSKVTK